MTVSQGIIESGGTPEGRGPQQRELSARRTAPEPLISARKRAWNCGTATIPLRYQRPADALNNADMRDVIPIEGVTAGSSAKRSAQL